MLHELCYEQVLITVPQLLSPRDLNGVGILGCWTSAQIQHLSQEANSGHVSRSDDHVHDRSVKFQNAETPSGNLRATARPSR